MLDKVTQRSFRERKKEKHDHKSSECNKAVNFLDYENVQDQSLTDWSEPAESRNSPAKSNASD